MNQASMPRPVEIASQASSGLASVSISARTSKGLAMSGLLVADLERRGLEARMYGHHDTMLASSWGASVVILVDERRHGARELVGEGCTVRGGGEPHLAVERKRRNPLVGLRVADDQCSDVAHPTILSPTTFPVKERRLVG